MQNTLANRRSNWEVGRDTLLVAVPLVGLYLVGCALWAMEVDPATIGFVMIFPQWNWKQTS